MEGGTHQLNPSRDSRGRAVGHTVIPGGGEVEYPGVSDQVAAQLAGAVEVSEIVQTPHPIAMLRDGRFALVAGVGEARGSR